MVGFYFTSGKEREKIVKHILHADLLSLSNFDWGPMDPSWGPMDPRDILIFPGHHNCIWLMLFCRYIANNISKEYKKNLRDSCKDFSTATILECLGSIGPHKSGIGLKKKMTHNSILEYVNLKKKKTR